MPRTLGVRPGGPGSLGVLKELTSAPESHVPPSSAPRGDVPSRLAVGHRDDCTEAWASLSPPPPPPRHPATSSSLHIHPHPAAQRMVTREAVPGPPHSPVRWHRYTLPHSQMSPEAPVGWSLQGRGFPESAWARDLGSRSHSCGLGAMVFGAAGGPGQSCDRGACTSGAVERHAWG